VLVFESLWDLPDEGPGDVDASLGAMFILLYATAGRVALTPDSFSTFS
jgi:hypothetical protein